MTKLVDILERYRERRPREYGPRGVIWFSPEEGGPAYRHRCDGVSGEFDAHPGVVTPNQSELLRDSP